MNSTIGLLYKSFFCAMCLCLGTVSVALAVEPSAYTLTPVKETDNWNYYNILNGVKTYYQITPKSGTHYEISTEGEVDFSIKSIKPGTASYSYHVTPQGDSQARVGVGAFTGNIGSESEPVVFHSINVDPIDPDKGGAVYNHDNTEGHSIYADFVSNETQNYGGGVRNGYHSSAFINKIVGNFVKNKAGKVGGAIANGADCVPTLEENPIINEIIGNFIGNTANEDGGAIYNQRTIAKKITGDFLSNTSGVNGGAIRNTDAGTIGNTTDSTSGILGNFVSNSSINGGAIYNEGTISNIEGDFILNTATTNGGAINNKGSSSKITNIIGNFSHNSANGGGAIYNFDSGEISNIAGDFESNSATTNGGAISNFGGSSKIGNIAGDFKGNHTDSNAGAIHNGGTIGNSDGTGGITGDFENNSATNMGGAIVNGNTINKVTGNFTKNSAKNGGAVYNAKTINFIAENDENITFSGNYVTEESGNGGAIFNATSGSVGLYASAEHSITFTGDTTGLPSTARNVDSIHNIGVLNINGNGTDTYAGTVNLYNVSDAGTARGTTNIYGGTVNVKDTFTQKDLNLKAGTFSLGKGGTVTNLNAEGGALSMSIADASYVNTIDTLTVQELNGDLTSFGVDYDATSSSGLNMDKIIIETGNETGSVKLTSVNVIRDAEATAETLADGKFLDGTLGNITDNTETTSTTTSGGWKYTFTPSSKGVVSVSRTATEETLAQVIQNPTGSSAFSINTNPYTTNENLGSLAGTGRIFAINGNGNTIAGNGYAGVKVNSGQTLTINNASMQNFKNSNCGGAIYNTGEINIVADNDTLNFDGNYVASENQGGAIYNGNGGTVGLHAKTINDSIVFTGNTANILDEYKDTALDVDGIYNVGTLNINGNGVDTYAGSASLQNVDGTGTTNIYGGVVNAKNSFVQASLYNEAEFNFDAAGKAGAVTTLSDAETAKGTTNIEAGSFTVNGTAKQKAINVASGAELTAKYNVTTTDGIANAGTLNLEGGTAETPVTLASSIAKYGETTGTTNINGIIALDAGKTIVNTVKIATDSSLELNAGLIGADKANITENLGAVIMNGGTLGSALAGNAEIKSDAAVTSDIANFTGTNAGTLTNNGTFYMSGDIVKDIAGNGTTVLQSDVVTANDGTVIDGILDGNGKTIDLQSNPATYGKFTVGGLKGTTNLKIDVNMVNKGESGTPEHDMAAASNLITLSGTSEKTDENNAVLNVSDILAYGITDVVPKYGTQTYNNFLTYAQTSGAGTFDNLTYQMSGYEKGDDNAKIVVAVMDDQSKPAREYTFTLGDSGKLNVDAKDTTLTLEQFITGSTNTETNSYELVSDYTTDGDLIGTTSLGDGGRTSPLTVKLVNRSSIVARTTGETEGITVDNGIAFNLQGVATPADQGRMTGFNTALRVNEGEGNVLNVENMVLTGNDTDIDNNATLNLAGTNAMDEIIGTGTTTIAEGGMTTVNSALVQDSLINHGVLTVGASALDIENGVDNQGLLVLNGGTLTTDISGGNLNVSDETSKVVNNATVQVANIGIFASLAGSAELENNGMIIANNVDNAGVLTANDNSYIEANVNGGIFNSNGNNTVVGSIQNGGESNPATLNLNGGALYMRGDLNVATTYANGGTLNLADGVYRTSNFGNMALAGNMDLVLDSNIATGSIDKIKADSVSGNGQINVTLNIPDRVDAIMTNPNITLNPIAEDSGAKTALARVLHYEGHSVTSPIFEYATSYDENTGLLRIAKKPGTDGINNYLYSAAAVARATAETASHISGIAMDQLETSECDKDAESADADLSKGKNAWLKVTGFSDDVEFNHFRTVDSRMLNTAFGFNTDTERIGEMDASMGVYAGALNGKHKYSRNSIEQEGGYIGLSARLAGDNAFLAASVNGGLLKNKDSNMYGTDRFDTRWLGLGLKSGYDFALAESWTLQPNLYAGYTFVNTEDYTSDSSVKVGTDDLHLFQIAPGLKLSYEMASGWRGYFQTKYVAILENGGDSDANRINLPGISTKNYLEYGLGVDKALSEAWSLGLELNRRDGGRTGWSGSAKVSCHF